MRLAIMQNMVKGLPAPLLTEQDDIDWNISQAHGHG